MEDYELAIKQDIVYDEAVEQASENYKLQNDKDTPRQPRQW
jgi:hypothetical protein